MIDIVYCAQSTGEYGSKLKGYYSEQLMSPEQLDRRRNPRVFDTSNKERADEAAKVLASFFGQKAKLEQRI